ncbi:hypothetical protein ACH5RR_000372 [Cinchona calisaya]|uniref:Diphthine methyl ester synthase n=1 Tax=Cinchona calisaya TaxID=153742 RepID=A0ABD3B0Z8_9GENT
MRKTSELDEQRQKLPSFLQEKLYEESICAADKEMVKENADELLMEAISSDVAFLVVGDPFGATTRTDLVRAKKFGVVVKVVNNASVLNAIGVCGLQLYRYRDTVSILLYEVLSS